MWEILETLLPAILTFVVGFVLKSPIYQKGKRLLSEVTKALEDDKLTADEIQAIVNVFKPPEKPDGQA